MATNAPMYISEIGPGQKHMVTLHCWREHDSSAVMAVLSRADKDWCIYIGTVRQEDDSTKWAEQIVQSGSKLRNEPVAEVMLSEFFYREPDLPYDNTTESRP